MTARPRDPTAPLPRAPGVQGPLTFLYPYEVLSENGVRIALPDTAVAAFMAHYRKVLGDDPMSWEILGITHDCWRHNTQANQHEVRLLAIGTLGVAPREVGDAIAWQEGYVAMHDGAPEPVPDLRDFHAFWTGDTPDALGGVCEESGLLCWWEAKLAPGRAQVTGYFLQALCDFMTDGPPERVNHVGIDRSVDAELRPLVTSRVARQATASSET